MNSRMKSLVDKTIVFVLSILERIIRPHPNITDPEERYLSRMLNSLLVIYVPLAIFVILLRYIVGAENFLTSAVVAGIGLIVVAIIYFIGRTGHFRASVYTTVILGYAVIYLNGLTSQPPHFAISYLIFIPLIGIVLFSFREAIINYGITLLLLFVFIATTPTMGDYGRIAIPMFVILSVGFILFATYQRDRLEKNRRELTVKKEQADLIKDLINNVSHDFRTPLATIRTSTYLLERATTPEKRQRAIDRIDRQTTQLEQMVKNLLTISRLDYGERPELLEVDLKLSLEAVIARLVTHAQNKQIDLQTQIDPELCHVIGNSELLDMMLFNVIENAINYTLPNGKIIVKLCQITPTQTQISIIDTASASLRKICNMFLTASTVSMKPVRLIQAGTDWGYQLSSKLLTSITGTFRYKANYIMEQWLW